MNKTQAAAVKIGDTLRTASYPAREVEVISVHQDGTRTARTWGDGHRVFPVFGVRVPNKDGHYLEEMSYSDLRVPQEVYEGDIIEEAGPCRECGGTGIYIKATWHAPAESCDECGGSGYDQEEEEARQKIMDERRAAALQKIEGPPARYGD